jgi:hypothetical protein
MAMSPTLMEGDHAHDNVDTPGGESVGIWYCHKGTQSTMPRSQNSSALLSQFCSVVLFIPLCTELPVSCNAGSNYQAWMLGF